MLNTGRVMNLTEITSTLASSPTLAAIGLAAIVLFFGFRFLATLNKDSPFAPYAIQIFALIIILPIVLTLALTAKFRPKRSLGYLGQLSASFLEVRIKHPHVTTLAVRLVPERAQRAGIGIRPLSNQSNQSNQSKKNSLERADEPELR